MGASIYQGKQLRVMFGCCAFLFTIASLLRTAQTQTARVPDLPEVRSVNHVVALTLRAVNDTNGHDAFAFNGETVPPVIRVSPGEVLKVEYINALPTVSRGSCAISPCMNMTNLHFHGLHVSPKTPQDDVLDMMAMPGQKLNYTVAIPRDQPPGLYWYHPHPHGESFRQVLDGMSGAIIVEGMDRYVPELRHLGERVLIIRERDIESNSDAAALRRRVAIPQSTCGTNQEQAQRIFTVNGLVRPQISIAPGERQFWRVVNAAADRYVDLQVDGQPLEVVARDGMPLSYHDRNQRARLMDHVLLPPAGRVEFIITGPADGSRIMLRTRCVDTGPDGPANPEMVLADVVSDKHSRSLAHLIPADKNPPVYKGVRIDSLEKSAPQFVVTFTEDKHGFYINGQKYAADDAPLVRVKVGQFQHWRIVNQTRERHPFHIHQVQFRVYAENGKPLESPEWLDTVDVPYGGSVDLMMDFTDPIIRGLSVFHCHLLNHEDKGMMAKILFE